MADLRSITNIHEMSSSKVSLMIENRVAHIVLNNPPLNSLTIAMLSDMSEALHYADREESVCAIVFEAAPKCRAFSAGFAIDELRADVGYQLLEAFHNLFRNIEYYGKPTVAVVSEAALGPGCTLAGFCDFVVAAEKARFGLPEIKMGLFPSVAAVYFPRIIGERRTREMILTGSLFSARDAQNMGLVNYVVPDDQLETKATEVLDRLRGLSAAVLGTTRRAMTDVSGRPVEEALERIEDIYLNQLLNLRDPGEGLVAIIEKRAPHWKHK